MTPTLRESQRKFQQEVEAEAVRIIEAGEAAPLDAIDIARTRVLERRQKRSSEKRLGITVFVDGNAIAESVVDYLPAAIRRSR